MSWKLNVRARAKSDVRRAKTWYQNQQDGLSKEFVDAVEEAFRIISLNPHVCQIYHEKYRQCLPTRFPYRILYFIDGRQVVVARVFHTSQDFTLLI
jgi:plasmid stabilization system protein ParE